MSAVPPASGFTAHVYAVAGDGSSAACVDCPSCDSGTPCTELEDTECTPCRGATPQFEIDDSRPASEIAALLQDADLEPVWKDWDEAILAR